MQPSVPAEGDGVVIGQSNASVTYVNDDSSRLAAVDVSNAGANTATLLQSQYDLNTNRLYVGITGKGAVALSGGFLTVTGIEGLSLGQGQGGSGSFTLSNWGTLTVAGQALLGDSGAGTFNQFGGEFIVNKLGPISGQILVGATPDATGAFNLAGGDVATDSIQVAPYGGNASVTQSGGSVTVRPGTDLSDLSVGDPAINPFGAGQSLYDHTGGAIVTPQLRIGRAGRFKQSGGTLKTGGLTINTAGGKLDLNQNMVVDYDAASGTPAASIRAYVKSGYHGGAWDGSGIMSAGAALNTARAVGYGEAGELLGLTGGATQTWNGQTVDASSILLCYTLDGDATLDGAVDFNDLVKLAQNYNAASGRTWTAGDFTYDDVVDFNDLVKLAQNYNAALPGEPIPGASASFATDVAAAFASVPEPGTMAFPAIAAAAMLLTRGRRPT